MPASGPPGPLLAFYPEGARPLGGGRRLIAWPSLGSRLSRGDAPERCLSSKNPSFCQGMQGPWAAQRS